MYNATKELTEFYNEEVRLPETTKQSLRSNRDANRTRLKKGLAKNEKPTPESFVMQGSNAMHTINQHVNNDYDIDDGAVFIKDDLKGPNGARFSPIDSRNMVRDAIDDGTFAEKPQVKTNCVRVIYKAGHHVDIPVYRQSVDSNENTFFELASVEWKRSDPEAVTSWYNNAVIDQSPDDTNGRQLRRITRLLKMFCKSRDSWNMPSGFIISKLVVDNFVGFMDRDDESIYETMKRIQATLAFSLRVAHPILQGEDITKTEEDACMREFKGKLNDAIDDLEILQDEDNCTSKAAMTAWRNVFNHSYFRKQLEENSTSTLKSSNGVFTSSPSKPVEKKGGGRFA